MKDESEWYVLRSEKAQAFGRPVAEGFLVRKGSTAMVDGAPNVKRDRGQRDRLVRIGVLVADQDPEVYRFLADYVFSSSSQAGGVVKDGNCSGPQSWRHYLSGKPLRESGG